MWMGMIASVFLVFNGMGISNGWIVAGGLAGTAAVWLLLMAGRNRRTLGHHGKNRKNDAKPALARSRPPVMALSPDEQRPITVGRRPQIRPRNLRPRFPKFAGSSASR